jgi:hypothetical protein
MTGDAPGDESVLQARANEVSGPVQQLLVGVPDERALGLLVDIDTAGPLAVRTMLSRYDCCESDLHGLLTECRVAGLLTETTVGGERGYETTEVAGEALAAIRE